MSAITFPFICYPDAAVWKAGITARAKCLFAALIACRNRRTGFCSPRLATLAERLGASLRTIKRALAELVRTGMVIIHRCQVGNRYEIATPDRWGGTTSVADCGAKSGPSEGPNLALRERHILIEPDVLQPEEEQRPAAAASVAMVRAAAAASTSCGCTATPTPPAAEALAVDLMATHPEPGNLPRAIAAAAKLLATRPEGAMAILEAVRRNHALWRDRWATYAPGRFIPQLWRWIQEGDWENPPVERKGVQSESYLERRAREKREYDEQFYRGLAEEEAWDVIRQYGGEHAVEVWREKIKNEEAA